MVRFFETLGGISKPFFYHICEDSSPFTKLLNMKILQASRGSIAMSLDFKDVLSGNPHPKSIHGGVTAALIDHAGGFCAWSTFEKPGDMLSTADLSVQYLAPLLQTDKGLICDATVQNEGDFLSQVDMTCWDLARTKKIATGRGVYISYRRKGGISDLRALFVNILFKIDITSTLSKATITVINKSIMRRHEAKHLSAHPNLPLVVDSIPVVEDVMFNGLTASQYVLEVEHGTVFGKEVLGLKVTALKRGKLSLRVPYRDIFVGNFLTPCLHGGVAAAVVDHCGGFCARTMLDDSSCRVSTVGLQLDYLAPVGCFEDLICDALVVNSRKDMIVVDVECWDSQRAACLVTCRASFNVYTPRVSYL